MSAAATQGAPGVVAPTDDDDNIQQLMKFLKLLKSAPNEALIGLIVDSLSVELANKQHRLQTVLDFALKDLPFSDEDFTRLKVSEKLLSLYSQFSTQDQARAILTKYNLQVSQIDPNLPKEKQTRAQNRFIERFERSIQVLPLNADKLEAPKLNQKSVSGNKNFKLVTFDSLLHQVGPDVAEEVAKNADGQLGRIASIFFDALIQKYDPLVASASDQGAAAATPQATTIQENKNGSQVVETQTRTKKQIESAIMGGYANMKAVKLSDFIDEKFLNDLVQDIGADSNTYSKSDKLPLSDIMVNSAEKSSILLPQMKPMDEVYAQSNKRRKVVAGTGDIQTTHLVMTPILALILNQTEYLLNQDWRRRQVAACNLRCILNQLYSKKVEQLDFWMVQKSSENGQMTIGEKQSIQLDDLVRNIMPRLLLFILKDNFSDFAGLKVQTPAREEAMKLLAEIQINSDKSARLAIQTDIKLLIRILPAIFKAVEQDVWHSKLNFFLIIKALVLRSSPESNMRQQILTMFSKLLIMSIPLIEDEPKVAVTEILQILLPTYLKNAQKIYDEGQQSDEIITMITHLLANLASNLTQSDEVDASSIAVFNLVCRVYDLKDEYSCLQDLRFKLDLNIFCPFNFHRIEAVRYSYNLLLTKALALSEHSFSVDELGRLHTLVVQSLAMENSPKIVKLLLKNLDLLVKHFGQCEPLFIDMGEQHPDQMQQQQSEVSKESAYANYLRQSLLLDTSLPAWLLDVQPNFETFLFYQSANFESIEGDYFQIVFRPANLSEWDKFYFDKTENLTRAIALMLSNCRDLDAANLIFSMMCCRTLTYDQNPESGAYEQRTLLNQSMLHLMMTMDRYTRKLGKQVRSGERSQVHANEDGILDLNYLLDLSGQFLGAQEKDVDVSECWQRETMQENLRELHDYAARQSPMIIDQLNIIDYYFNSFSHGHSFHYEMEFRTAVEDLDVWIKQLGDNTLQTTMSAFYQQYQSFIFFAFEYVGRLKAQAAAIIVNLSSLALETEDKQTVFAVDRDFVLHRSNEVVKSLLNIINQERLMMYKRWSAQAVVALLRLAGEHGLTVLVRRTLVIIVRMIQQPAMEGEPNGDPRLQTCSYLAAELVKCTKNVTIYEAYGGVLGNVLFKPAWLNASSDDSPQCKAEQENQVLAWIHAVFIFTKSQIPEKNTLTAELALRYQVLGFGAIVKLLVRALHIVGESEILLTVTYFPELIDFLFPRLTVKHRAMLIETLVGELEAHSRVAFDSLNKLLETQIKRGSDKNTVTFFKYLPAFVLPVIKAIQASQKIYPTGGDNQGVGIMKILAKLIQLLPLRINSVEQGKQVEEQDANDTLAEMTKLGLEFLAVFADNKIVTEYELVVPMKLSTSIKLRDYQREGINWIAQLGQYNLNCALCDDMGLGKTLQSLCVVLNESEKIKLAQIKEHGRIVDRPCNLVVCPSTLTYNWKQEIEKFFDGQNVIIVEGTMTEREFQLAQLDDCDILIINYEKVKKCLPSLLEKEFFYIVLDEAHKIKNAKSVITQATKQLRGQRKLALSGTPLQNRVGELWSLFDFLMPDFLEEEVIFNKTYNKYLTGNIKKMSENLEETQQFIDALKSLKRRIAPFILRRTKEQVLKELPPKVIQDYPCSMPAFQAQVHLEVEKQFPFASSVQSKQAPSDSEKKPEVRMALRNLILHRKACNHPELLRDSLPDLFNSKAAKAYTSDYTASGKLQGLVEVLQQTEIISSGSTDETKATSAKDSAAGMETSLAEYAVTAQNQEEGGGAAVMANQPHRALIFCQMSSCLELVCKQVLDRFGVKYQKLLGTSGPKDRLQIVNQFNHDSSVRVLILTTAVGGLGLTLTGADVVIFVEHDWNPMADLQAMDRAHRIGQQRTVNVYRLIMRDTIEDKIMNLQRFKENLARSLIQARGGDVSTTEVANLELTDLLKSFEEHTGFQQGSGAQAAQAKEQKPTKGAKMMKHMISGGLPIEEGMGISGQAGDTELANIEQIWQAVSDVEEN